MTPGVSLAVPMNPSPNMGQVVPIRMFFREPALTDTKYPIGQVVVIGKDPVSGTQGDLWWLANFNSSGQAIWKQFLSGAGSPGVDSITTDDGAPAVEPDVNGNINIIGGVNVSVTGNGPGDTVTITATGGGFTWVEVQVGAQALAANTAYIADNGTIITFTLPVTAVLGDTFKIVGKGVGGWELAQNVGQTTYFGMNTTTPGVAGSITFTNRRDVIEIVCITADTEFEIINSIGNLTVV